MTLLYFLYLLNFKPFSKKWKIASSPESAVLLQEHVRPWHIIGQLASKDYSSILTPHPESFSLGLWLLAAPRGESRPLGRMPNGSEACAAC